jgi:parallel beta-helix repeat protein
MNARTSISAGVLWCLLGSATPVAAQSIRYVDDDASTNGTGLDWEHAYRYLQDAFFPVSGDPGIAEIRVAGGTYKPDQEENGGTTPGDREATFHLLDGLAIMGGYRGCPGGDCAGGDPNERDIELYLTVLSGDLAGNDGPEPFENYDENSYHVVVGSGCDPTAVLDGVTVSSGCADGSYPHFSRGGGMYNYDESSPTVANCTFASNWGSGMYNYYQDSDPTVINCVFSGNWGSGMFSYFGSSPMVANCTFSGNWATVGGGMCNNQSHPTVVNCIFAGNSAQSNGGGVYNASSWATLTGCTFQGNAAQGDGGGLCNRHASPAVADCTFSGNWAGYDGGGMCNFDCNPDITSCTFSGNAADYRGGGMFNYFDSNPTVANCMFSGNQAWVGAGMANLTNCSPTLTSCVFNGNSAECYGGGMYSYGHSSPIVGNCTFNGNSAQEYGGGMFTYSYSVPVLANCILWNDLPEEIDGEAEAMYSNIQGGWPGEGNINADPLFVYPGEPDDTVGDGEYNLRLLGGSPSIDAGNNLAVPEDWADLDGDGDTTERTPLDLWGIPRFIDDLDTDDTGVPDPPDYPAVVDMGAYEYQLPGDLDFDGDIDGDDYWLFAAAIPSCAGDPQYNPAADLDFDGCVTLADYTIWLQLYREANPPLPAPAPRPKPGGPDDTGGPQAEHQRGDGLAG